MKQPIAMRCNETQFEKIKPELIKNQLEFNSITDFEDYPYLVNCDGDSISNVHLGFDHVIKELNTEVHEEWNEKIFLKACGIEVEKTFSITESQIKKLKKDITNGYHVDAIDYLEKLFPETVENEVKLEVGKWYFVERSKSQFDDKQRALVFYEDKEKIYGFTHGGWWCNDYGNPKYDKYKFTEATEQEVFEALKNEAVKRGFSSPCIYKPTESIREQVHINGEERWGFIFEENKLLLNNYRVFHKGKWAEVIESITLSEAEQQLGKKIIV